MQGLILTPEQIEAGDETLTDANKLTGNQVDDLVSICRNFLGPLAASYALRDTFESLTDTADSSRCAKLAACLLLWQENGLFDASGFAATAANKTGYYDDTALENYNIFKYVFGMFWDLPPEIENRWTAGASRKFAHGNFRRVL